MEDKREIVQTFESQIEEKVEALRKLGWNEDSLKLAKAMAKTAVENIPPPNALNFLDLLIQSQNSNAPVDNSVNP